MRYSSVFPLDAYVAEKFLAHLKGENVIAKRTFSSKISHINLLGDRPAWRPHSSITYGSYYPEYGNGNNTGVFRIVKGSVHELVTPPERITKGSTERPKRLPDFNQTPPKNDNKPLPPRTRPRKKSMDSALCGIRIDKNHGFNNDRAKTARFRTRTKSPVRFSDKIDVIQPSAGYPSKIKFSANMQRREKKTGRIPQYSDENLMYSGPTCQTNCISPLPTTSYAYFYASYPYEVDRHGSRAGREKRRLSGEFQLSYGEQ